MNNTEKPTKTQQARFRTAQRMIDSARNTLGEFPVHSVFLLDRDTEEAAALLTEARVLIDHVIGMLDNRQDTNPDLKYEHEKTSKLNVQWDEAVSITPETFTEITDAANENDQNKGDEEITLDNERHIQEAHKKFNEVIVHLHQIKPSNSQRPYIEQVLKSVRVAYLDLWEIEKSMSDNVLLLHENRVRNK